MTEQLACEQTDCMRKTAMLEPFLVLELVVLWFQSFVLLINLLIQSCDFLYKSDFTTFAHFHSSRNNIIPWLIDWLKISQIGMQLRSVHSWISLAELSRYLIWKWVNFICTGRTELKPFICTSEVLLIPSIFED